MTSTCAQRGRRSVLPAIAMRVAFVAGIVTATWLGGFAVASATTPPKSPADHHREYASRALPLDPSGRIESRLSAGRFPEFPDLSGHGQQRPAVASKVRMVITTFERTHGSGSQSVEPSGSDHHDVAERVEQAIDEHRAAAPMSPARWSPEGWPLDGQPAVQHLDGPTRTGDSSTPGSAHPATSDDSAASPAEPATVSPMSASTSPADAQQHGSSVRAVSAAPDRDGAASKTSARPSGHEQDTPVREFFPHQVPLPLPPSPTLCTATPCPGTAGARGALVFPVRQLTQPDSVLVRLGAPTSIQPSSVVPEGPSASPD